MESAALIAKADELLAAPESLSTAASTDAPVTERELAALHAEFSKHKNKLIDLQTKRNLAASFASSSPFAVLDNNAQAIAAGFREVKAEVKAVKRGLEEDRKAAADQAAVAAEVLAAYTTARADLENAKRQLEEAAAEEMPPASVTVYRDGHPLVISSEAEARRVTAEEMMHTAEMRSRTMQMSIETVQSQEKCQSIAKEVDALTAHLNRLKAERAARTHAAKTEAEKALEAEAYYNTLTQTLKHIMTSS